MKWYLDGWLIAPQARRWIEGAAQPIIHSLYRQSANLIDPDMGMFSLVLPEVGPGPFALVVRQPNSEFLLSDGFRSLAPRGAVAVEGDVIVLESMQVSSASARGWDPIPDWQSLGARLAPDLLDHIAMKLAANAPPGSFAPLADRSAELKPSSSNDLQARALVQAAQPAKILVDGMASGEAAEVAGAAEQLAGLGGGVTPSGDDYLIGAIYAGWAKLAREQIVRLSEAIVRHAVPRTNSISAAWLEAAARAETGEDWHLLIESLDDEEMLESITIRLLRRGHTSGADAVAGFLATARALG